MAKMIAGKSRNYLFSVLVLVVICVKCNANDILGCGGFIKSHANLDYSKIEIGLYTKEGSLKEKTECAPTNGYYFLPLYEKGDYVLKVHPPAGWSFEPSQVELSIDGESDQCSTGQDVNFVFNGFGITGKVVTAGQNDGPAGVKVQLVSDKGDVRETVTAVGGDFHFTPVIPGQYSVKASHPKWKLEPSQTTVQVKEGNTVLPVGSLAIRGYDVRGSVVSYGKPVSGMYVLLYSKEDPKYRVEGCNTALLQGVPDSPICHSVTDASGEFSFGLVPAGEYHLLAMSKTPGQAALSYNLEPNTVKFTVKHDSQYIKEAFRVTGYTVTGQVQKTKSREALTGVRVSLDGKPVAVTDASGKYTLTNLQPSDGYTVTFKHESCEIDAIKVTIPAGGVPVVPVATVSRWRVCGAVRGGAGRDVLVRSQGGTLHVTADHNGDWCTFLAPGEYTAQVEVSGQEQSDGVQFYPTTQKISVSTAPVSDVVFSQLRARVSGRVVGLSDVKVPVTLRSVDGRTETKVTVDGAYTFENVAPGTIEVSVSTDRYCWAAPVHKVTVSAAEVTVPNFQHTGYRISVHTEHAIQVEYESEKDRGVFNVEPGTSSHCVKSAAKYTLTGKSCHLLSPASVAVDTTVMPQPVHFKAVAHAFTVKVVAQDKVSDLELSISSDATGTTTVGPLEAVFNGDQYVYTHVLYLAEGEVRLVSARSSKLLAPAAKAVGGSSCGGAALAAVRATVVAGVTQPPLAGVQVTLTADDDLVLKQTTGPDGKYSFGPLDASKKYTVRAEKESYVLSEPDAHGVIAVRKLAEIVVTLLDDADGTPLEGALVSVSGGSYRRNAVSAAEPLRFPSLAPTQYYVKPHDKEHRFTPPHQVVDVAEGATVPVTLRGVRVAWRCSGRVSSLAGAGRAAIVLATPATPSASCHLLETKADADGQFRLRGLVPGCKYSLHLKQSTEPDMVGLKLAHPAVEVEVTEKKDIDNIRLIAIQPNQITDTNVLVYTPNLDHYKSLRLKLALEESPNSPIYTVKLDSSGYQGSVNPGLMYALPRLPADNKTYVLQLESSLSKATHAYEEEMFFFNSDGQFKHFNIEFVPKVKSSEQELRQTSLLVVPLLAIIATAFFYRDQIIEYGINFATNLSNKTPPKPTKPNKMEILDKASIDQILYNVNNTGKRQGKKKAQLIS